MQEGKWRGCERWVFLFIYFNFALSMAGADLGSVRRIWRTKIEKWKCGLKAIELTHRFTVTVVQSYCLLFFCVLSLLILLVLLRYLK